MQLLIFSKIFKVDVSIKKLRQYYFFLLSCMIIIMFMYIHTYLCVYM